MAVEIVGIMESVEDLGPLLEDLIGDELSTQENYHSSNAELLRKSWDRVIEISSEKGFTIHKESGQIVFRRKT